jgi:hypothetical protein
MRNTSRNATTEATVFRTSCHVSEKPNTGPTAVQRIRNASATRKLQKEPTSVSAPFTNRRQV